MLYFIVNETARTGKGISVWRQVQTELRAQKLPYKAYMTKHRGHAAELARMISEKEEEETICIIAVGGDGTLNEVINGVTDFEKVRISLIPAGSGNDFARGVGIGREPKERLLHILEGVEKTDGFERIDLGQVKWPEGERPHLYAISSGVGMDALVCKKNAASKVKVFMNRLGMGKLSYLIITVRSLVTMETADMAVKAEGMGTLNFKKTIFAAAMNARAEGGGVPMAPGASMQDGLLSVSIVYKLTKLSALFCLPFLAAGKQEHLKGFQQIDCEEISLKLKKPMALHTDGEYLGDVTEVSYRCLPGRMKFII